jgi:hypothetical protein
MGGACLRVRCTRWWFRRRVPDSLTGRLGLREVTRSLRTSCPREAMRRGRLACLAMECAFRQMTKDRSLDAERALVLVRRLLKEALDDSPTAEEIVRRWRANDTSLAGQLFTRSPLEIVPEIPEDERPKRMLHLERILDRLDAATARERVAVEQERAALAVHRPTRSAEREQTARDRMSALEAKVMELEREIEVERRVRERLELRAGAPGPASPPADTSVREGAVSTTVATTSAVSASANHVHRPAAVAQVADRGPLFSANEATYLTRRAEPAPGAGALGPKSRDDAEVAFWLWRGLAGDRPMLDDTREEADDRRVVMLRMLASYGKGRLNHAMRAKFAPRHWIEEADRRQQEIDRHNVALPEGHPDRKPAVERMPATVRGAVRRGWFRAPRPHAARRPPITFTRCRLTLRENPALSRHGNPAQETAPHGKPEGDNTA